MIAPPPNLMFELRELALVSRLRRLGDALWEETAGLYGQLGFDFQPRWFAVFYAIGARDRRSVSELARIVGLTSQGVGKIVDELVGAGLVRVVGDAGDARVRRVALAARGRTMRGRLEPVWRGIGEVARQLMVDAEVDLVGDLDRLESALAERSHGHRLRQHFGLPEVPVAKIMDYRPAFKKYFRALNEEWLSGSFNVEPGDAKVLADPNGRVLKRGGHILFALRQDQVVGTCALIRHPCGELELAKMAVAAAHRCQGVGTSLAVAAIERALASGEAAVYLRTHPSLVAARHLYRKVGFRRVVRCPLLPSEVSRDGVPMRLNVDAYRRFRRSQEDQ